MREGAGAIRDTIHLSGATAMRWFATAGILAGLIVATASGREDRPPKGAPKVGEICVLNDEESPELENYGVGITRVLIDDAAWDEYVDASDAGDSRRLGRMVAAGKLLPVPNGTRARVIEYDDGTYRVLVLEGEYEARSGWVDEETVKPFGIPLKKPAPRASTRKKAGDGGPRKPAPRAAAKVDDEARAASLLRTGKALEKAGKTEAALADYREVVARYPKSSAARSATERIRSMTDREK